MLCWGSPANSFSYVYVLAVLAPTARAKNRRLLTCNDFAKKNLLEFSPLKSAILLNLPRRCGLPRSSNNYLGDNVESFKYLCHTISAGFMDDLDVDRERSNSWPTVRRPDFPHFIRIK